MNTSNLSGSKRFNPNHNRRGSVMTLMAMLLPVLAILAAFCINTAHMQLTRTELIVATDAAARAGGRAFSEEQTVAAAKLAALTTAAMNMVDNQPLMLRTNDGANEMEFGITTQPNGTLGRYEFQKIPTSVVESGEQVASAFRVNGARTTGSLSGKVNLKIPGLLDANDFSTTQNSVAMQVDRDISLILDRSGSMEWATFNWPNGMSPNYNSTKSAAVDAGLMYRNWRGRYRYSPGVSELDYHQWAWEHHYELGPAPTTPWQDLVQAVNAFLDVLAVTSQEEQVSVASYSNNASLDTWLEKNHQIVRNEVNTLNTGGSTAIGKGMQKGMQALLDNAARPYAAKTMVVMTDGNHNSGIDPDNVATTFMGQYNLTIHTVTFGDGADQALMQTVANIGGGKHYHAADGAQLVAIFEEIANNLPTILTK